MNITRLLQTSLILFAPLFFCGIIRAEKYTLKIGDFNEIKVINNVNVVYSNNPDSLGYAVFYGDRQYADAFLFSNKNGCLKIEVSTENVDDSNLPTLHIYSKFLQKVEVSSEHTTHIRNVAPTPELKIKLIGNGEIIVDNIDVSKINAHLSTGNGKIRLNGECMQASYKMVGTGEIDAENLESDEVDCAIFGTGQIRCWAVESLKSKGIGSTKIYYKGSPTTLKKSGGGTMIQIEENIISSEK